MNATRLMKGLACTAIAAGAAAASADVIVSFSPVSQNTTVGGTASYDIVADITAPILGWGLDLIVANPGVASVSNVTVDPQWATNPGAGDADGLNGLAFPNSISGAGIRLATVELTGDSLGTTALNLAITAGDNSEGFALDPTGFDGNVTLNTGALTVVPEPASLALLALGAVAMFRRR